MKQSGQALIELIVLAMAVLLILAGLLALQRWQQIKLQTQHHASLAAFYYSQSYALDPQAKQISPMYLQGLFSPIPHQQQLTSHSLAPYTYQAEFLNQAQNEALFAEAQRRRFVSTAKATTYSHMAWQLPFEWLQNMQLSSQSSIWVGAGEVFSSAQMVERLAQSASLWRTAKQQSDRVLTPAIKALRPIDAAWSRPLPRLDWLQPWHESVPENYVQ